MGSVNDSMHSYVLRDLKNMFSPSEGWEIERAPLCGDYQVSRKRFGTTKRYPVNVVIAPEISADDVENFNAKIITAEAEGLKFDYPIFFVPSGADVTAVPGDAKVKELKVLKVENGEVLWWKKTHAEN